MSALRSLWRRLTAPSPALTGQAERRQAQLMAGLLVVLIPLAILSELFTVISLASLRTYRGYWITIVAVSGMAVAYGLSRTRHARWGGVLIVIISSLAVLVGGVGDAVSVNEGFLDFLIMSLLLGSGLVSLRLLVVLGLGNLAGLLLVPWLNPAISYRQILVGSFTFNLLAFAILVFMTRHRDQLERDRLADLAEREARTAALLRVANRLNTVLAQDTVLAILCDEACRALLADATAIFLYDPQRDVLSPAAAHGLGGSLASMPPVPRRVHERVLQRQNQEVVIPDVLADAELSRLREYLPLGIRSFAYANVQHETHLLGGLAVFSLGRLRQFTEDDRLLLRGLADQAALSLVTTRLYQDAQRRLERLQALRAIDIAISSRQGLPETLDVLLEQITRQLDVSAALVLLLEPQERELVYSAGRGFRTTGLLATRLPWGQGYAGRAAAEKGVIAVSDLREHLDSFRRATLLQAEGFVSYFAAPLLIQGEVRGVIELFDRERQAPDPEWLNFLEALAGQAAIAIDNLSLVDELQRSNVELAQAYDSTLEGWSRALDMRDHETEGHTRRVVELSLALAAWVGGFSAAELVHLQRGALLHDIGKMGIPDSILLKPGPLDEAEWAIMRQHPRFAYDMLQSIAYLRPALDIPLAHHEWWDGSGYPQGLAGEAIPRAARLFAVVDVWDALRSDRPYRRAWPVDRVRAYLAERAATQFDPALLAAFLDMQAARPPDR